MTSYETWVKENIGSRKPLVTAVREQVYPLFKELGFRRGRKPPPGVEPDIFGLGYGRIREGHHGRATLVRPRIRDQHATVGVRTSVDGLR